MNVTAIIRDMIARFRVMFTLLRKRICRRRDIYRGQISRPGRRFAVATGNIDDIFRLVKPDEYTFPAVFLIYLVRFEDLPYSHRRC